MDCSLLPDSCDYVVEHLLEDRENQYLDGKKHGYWGVRWENGKMKEEINYVEGVIHVFLRGWRYDGRLWWESIYVNGKGLKDDEYQIGFHQ